MFVHIPGKRDFAGAKIVIKSKITNLYVIFN